jgi:hypothetical protein
MRMYAAHRTGMHCTDDSKGRGGVGPADAGAPPERLPCMRHAAPGRGGRRPPSPQTRNQFSDDDSCPFPGMHTFFAITHHLARGAPSPPRSTGLARGGDALRRAHGCLHGTDMATGGAIQVRAPHAEGFCTGHGRSGGNLGVNGTHRELWECTSWLPASARGGCTCQGARRWHSRPVRSAGRHWVWQRAHGGS